MNLVFISLALELIAVLLNGSQGAVQLTRCQFNPENLDYKGEAEKSAIALLLRSTTVFQKISGGKLDGCYQDMLPVTGVPSHIDENTKQAEADKSAEVERMISIHPVYNVQISSPTTIAVSFQCTPPPVRGNKPPKPYTVVLLFSNDKLAIPGSAESRLAMAMRPKKLLELGTVQINKTDMKKVQEDIAKLYSKPYVMILSKTEGVLLIPAPCEKGGKSQVFKDFKFEKK